MDKNSNNTLLVVNQDVFTLRLIDVCESLLANGLIRFEKDFTKMVFTRQTNFNHMKQRYRNYPKSDMKRNAVIAVLNEKFKINPDYLRGRSSTMYSQQPTMEYAVVEYVKKQPTKKQREEILLQTIKNLEEQLAEVRSKIGLADDEQRPEYETKKGNNLDKNLDKEG